jgi:hypothetical protein
MLQLEQRANIKFMCKLGKGAAEMLQALNIVYSEMPGGNQSCITGTVGSRVNKNYWKTSLTVGDLQYLKVKECLPR